MSRRLSLLYLLLTVACAAPPEAEPTSFIGNHDPASAVVAGIERDGDGAFYAGVVERFQLVLSEEGPWRVEWSASGGELSPDGRAVTWQIPRATIATLTVELFDGSELVDRADLNVGPRVPIAYNPSAQGQVDATPDTTGARCALVFDAADAPHIVYHNGTHYQLFYAEWSGTQWDTQLVDGPGLDVGSTVAAIVDMVLDSSGRPHIAYRYLSAPYEVRYAHHDGSGWTRERVDSTWSVKYDSQVGIDLDPVNGNRPTIAYTFDSGTEYVIINYRTGADTWVSQQQPSDYTEWDFTGGIEFDGSGDAWLTFGTDDRFSSTWSALAGFSTATLVYSDTTDAAWAPVTLDNFEEPLILHQEGLEHRVSGVFGHSEIESSDSSYMAIDWRGRAHVALRHGTNLELVTTNAEGYWQYTVIDSMNAAVPDVAVDSDGDPHACYQNNSAIHYY